MRTTLDIDDDVLAAARELAGRKHTTVGKFISDVVRETLQVRSHPGSTDKSRCALHAHGFDPIPGGGTLVTDELVNELREESGN